MFQTAFTTCIAVVMLWTSVLADEEAKKISKEPLPVPAAQAVELPENWSGPKPDSATGNRKLGNVDAESKLVPAVHVNSNGVDSTYGGTATNGAVNRLRSVRDSIFLPPQTTKAADLSEQASGAVKSTVQSARRTFNTAKDQATEAVGGLLNNSSRRTQKTVKEPAPKIIPKTATTQTPPAQKVTLPSVIAKRNSGEPTLADATVKTTVTPTEAPSTTTQAPLTLSTKPAPLTLAPVDNSSLPATAKPRPAERVASRPADPIFSAEPTGLSPNAPLGNINPKPAPKPAGDTFTASPSTTPRVATSPLRPQSQPAKANRAKPPVSKPESNLAEKNDEDTVLLSNRSPVLVVKTHGQPTIRVGRVAHYYVTAANLGDLAAEDVLVSVKVPNWAELTGNHASSGMVRIEPSSTGDNVLKWSIRDLKAQNKQRLKIDLIPRASRPIELGVTWNFKSVSALAQIEVQEAKLQLSVSGPADIRYGETKLYTITASNPGTGDAENVVLTLLPIHERTGTAGTREIGTIKAGARRTIEVELTARQAGELAVKASVTGDGGLQADAKQDVLVRRPNLIVEAVGPAKKYAGTPARYRIKVTNNGDATAQNVVVVAALPMASEYVKSSNAGSYDKERGRVRWTVGSLRPGAFQIVEATAVLTGSGSNRLDVRSAGAEQLTASGSVVTEVEALADLRMTVMDPAGVVPLGEEMIYEVHVVNRGTKAANNVNIVGYFSEGIEPVAVQGWRADVEVGQVILETIPRINPGQEMVVKVLAQASRPGNHVFRTELDSKDPQTKLAVEEWTVFHREDGKSDLSGPRVQQANQGTSPSSQLK